jgi:short-subunit dehydrogenase
MSTENETRPRALVTGASAGLGQAFAERLARDGYDLVVVARRRDRLEELAQRLRESHGIAVQVLQADLTQPAELRAVETEAAGDERLGLVVNNAGFGGYMPFIMLDPDRAEELIRLHVVATTRLTRAALPGMVARGRGAIVNVASVLGFSASVPASVPLPKRAVYAACKSYIISFAELLHQDLEGTGVHVQALCPGLVGGTEFHDAIPGFDISRRPTPPLGPDDVVTAALAGLRLGEVICVPGLDDPDQLAQIGERERALVARAATGRLASRYTT